MKQNEQRKDNEKKENEDSIFSSAFDKLSKEMQEEKRDETFEKNLELRVDQINQVFLQA